MTADLNHQTDTDIGDDIDAWLNAGKPQTGQIDVCLAGDVRDEHDLIVSEVTGLTQQRKLVDEAAETMAERAQVRVLDEQVTALQDRLDVIKDRMRAATRTFHMTAIDPTEYRQMQIAHPPRDEDPHDGAFGVNFDTFFPALVKACTVTPALTDAQWAALLPPAKMLSSLQWDRMWGLAHSLNRRELSVPKSPTPSAETRSSEETSKQPGDSGSPSND